MHLLEVKGKDKVVPVLWGKETSVPARIQSLAIQPVATMTELFQFLFIEATENFHQANL
jgi:hypothetical protein